MVRVYRVTFTDALGEDSMYFNGTSLADVNANFARYYPEYDLVAVRLIAVRMA